MKKSRKVTKKNGKSKVEGKTFQDKYEKEFVRDKLSSFDSKKSRAWNSLTKKFGPVITQNQLLCIAQIVSNKTNIGLYREYKRRKEMLIKWFDENYDIVWPIVEKNISVIKEDGQVI